MNITKQLELMNKYEVCPCCGNDKIGNGEGTLNLDENSFERTCKCGWKIKYTEKDNKIVEVKPNEK